MRRTVFQDFHFHFEIQAKLSRSFKNPICRSQNKCYPIRTL